MIEQNIRTIIARELNVDQCDTTARLAYGEIPEWTSASHMNVIIAVEEEYGIEFSPDDIADLTDIDAIVAAVRERVGEDS
jgi:acyl carrier protein